MHDARALLARRIYLSDLDAFDALYARVGGDVRAAAETVMAVAKRSKDRPFDGLGAWLAR